MMIYTYRPTGCVESALLFVFHGNSRTASNYLEYARPLADRACFLAFAPCSTRSASRTGRTIEAAS